MWPRLWILNALKEILGSESWSSFHFQAWCRVLGQRFDVVVFRRKGPHRRCEYVNIYYYIPSIHRITGLWSEADICVYFILWLVLCMCLFMWLLWLRDGKRNLKLVRWHSFSLECVWMARRCELQYICGNVRLGEALEWVSIFFLDLSLSFLW